MSAAPLEAARALGPLIRASAAETDAQRELPRPLFEAMADAGLFRLGLPRAVGGVELDLPSYIEVIEEIGKNDASTGWVTNQVAIFATYAARMPREAARAIWIETPRSVVANTPMASAQAVVVPGGYRVTGRQGFSTGCRHASWLAAHGTVIEQGRPRLDQGEPELRYCFVPRAEAQLLDTWQVRGMRGTGTHHFAVDDVFVPEERTVKSVTAPLVETGPLYQIPRTLVFASGDASVALATARSCLATFVELATTKTPRAMEALLRDQAMVQNTVGRAEADLRSGRAYLADAVGQIWRSLTQGDGLSLEQRANLRLATTHGIRLAVQVVDAVYNMAGATAVYDGNPIQRYFQDVHVISQHLQARLSHYELVGRHWLGLKVEEGRF
jgi:alkylation response protein AidB-like acyl-CoA dehydrogenase